MLENDKVITEQVHELLNAGQIREVQFLTWLLNAVLAQKATGKLRLCVDFRYMKKSCSKYCYPLPQIEQLLDSTFGI